jgi:hypothetical protein
VWLGGFDAPTISALIGGGIIIITLIVNSYLSMRQAEEDEQKGGKQVEVSFQPVVNNVPPLEDDGCELVC